MTPLITVGAVAYAPRAVDIWEGMRDYFRAAGPAIDYVLFSNYDRQVRALLDRHIQIAWNTNLAWVKLCAWTRGHCRALAMRDVDVGFTTVFVARAGSGINALADLRGKRLALGSADSGQAAILPIYYLRKAGLHPDRDLSTLRFDVDVGKHGDTGTSELAVLRAVGDDQADAGALASSTWHWQLQHDKVDVRQITPFWTSPGYCHCNFSVLSDFSEALGQEWTSSLLAMSYHDARWRQLMDLEGLKRWVPVSPAILQGYNILAEAASQQGLLQ